MHLMKLLSQVFVPDFAPSLWHCVQAHAFVLRSSVRHVMLQNLPARLTPIELLTAVQELGFFGEGLGSLRVPHV